VTRLAILAYGSLINDPGDELNAVIDNVIDGVTTPFKVEFARSSRTRRGAPTLVPVESGGAHVQGSLLVLRTDEPIGEARSKLWRRETGQIGTGFQYPMLDPVHQNSVVVKEHEDLGGVDLVLSTWICSNISPLTADKLADLAITSATTEAGIKGRDGISYLINATLAGIRTPLTDAYSDAILAQTNTANLEDAQQMLVSGI
jgi:cation transport regulator ChaC